MATEAPITHPFASAKSDGPDTTLVRPSNWNANHKATGGADGQAAIWDSAQASSLGWGRFDHLNWAFNGDMELWGAGVSATPTGWRLVGAGATISKDTTNKKFGAAAAALVRAGTDCYLVQDVSLIWNNLTWFKSRLISIGASVRCATGAVARLVIDDGITTAASSYHTGDSTFQFLKVEKTIDATATKVELRLQIDTGNATAQFDAVILSTGGKAELGDFVPSSWRGRKCVLPFMAVATQAQNTTQFYNSAGTSATENLVEFNLPFRGVARNLLAVLDSAPAAGQTVTFTLRKNTADSSPAITAQATSAARDISDVTNMMEFLTTDEICMKVVTSATSGARACHATLEYEEIPASF